MYPPFLRVQISDFLDKVVADHGQDLGNGMMAVDISVIGQMFNN